MVDTQHTTSLGLVSIRSSTFFEGAEYDVSMMCMMCHHSEPESSWITFDCTQIQMKTRERAWYLIGRNYDKEDPYLNLVCL